MVELVFNWHGFNYQESLSALRRSFALAERAVYTEIENAQAELLAYEKGQAEGEPFVGELDEAGRVIWGQDEILEGTVRAASEALHTLRRSYAIATYHAWERGARLWTGAHRGVEHAKLVRKVEKLGLVVDPTLETLRIVANVLKHDNDYWGGKLVAAAPELVDGIQVTPPHRTDWYEAVRLPAEWMSRFFEAARDSGPDMSTTFKT